MIVCHSRKFIYVKTKKTASTSIEIALSKFCVGHDFVTMLAKKDEKLRRKLGGKAPNELRQEMTAHSTAKEIKEQFGDDIWNEYFKITSVRNTYDMMVSKYFWEKQKQPDFDAWYDDYKKSARCNWDIYTVDGVPAMDFYIRHDHILEDCSKLSEILGLDSDLATLVRRIKTKHKHREEKWPQISKQSLIKIAKDARKEIEFFNYEIPEVYKEVLNNGE